MSTSLNTNIPSGNCKWGEAPEGAEVFNAGRFYPEDKEDIEFYITGIEPDAALVTLKDRKGNLLPNNQTNITRSLARRLNIKAGDTVTFINKEDGKPYSFKIEMQLPIPTSSSLYLCLSGSLMK